MLVLVAACWVAAVQAQQSGSCNSAPSDACSTTGQSSTYAETINGDTREIRAMGCPNSNPLTNCLGDNPSMAAEQDWEFDIPATPRFKASTYSASLSSATSLGAVGGLIGMTLNGVEVRSCYGGTAYGECSDWSSSAVLFESDTFEYCGGHGNPHHYHNAPVCLLAQMGIEDDGSSPQVGWAADGFPIMGPRGPGGVKMKQCGENRADDYYCLDACGGFYGSWNGDDEFLYRYFLMGSDDVVLENPLSPEPDGDYFPHAPFCLVGCGDVSASGEDRTPSIGREIPSCGSGASAGTTDAYVPEALTGVTAAFATYATEWPYGETYGGEPSPAPAAPTPAPTPAPGDPSAAPKPAPTPRPTPYPILPLADPPTPRPVIIPTMVLHPPPTAEPTREPVFKREDVCEDDDAWYKKNAPAKDCAWVAAAPADRCAAKGDDAQAWQACPVACDACPYDCGDADDSPSWHKNGAPWKDCAWVAEFYYNRAGVKGADGTEAWSSCPAATRRCYFDACDDSDAWAKRGAPWKDCAWVAAATSRCIAVGEDLTFGFEGCPAACLACNGLGYDGLGCDDDAAWHKKNSPSKDCAWVANDAPRCSAKGEDGAFAFEACPGSCVDACA